MLSRSLRTPQLTQTTGICFSRKVLINAASGWIGLRFGLTSMPRESSQPPLVQKSFCISTMSNADFAASTVMFCGSAAIASGRTAGAGRVISTASGVTIHDWLGLVPISTGADGFAVTFMDILLTPRRTKNQAQLLGCAGDALDEVVHRLDLLHRKLLAGRRDNGAVLLGNRTFPDRFLAGVDIALELVDVGLRAGGHRGTERIEHDVAAGEIA